MEKTEKRAADLANNPLYYQGINQSIEWEKKASKSVNSMDNFIQIPMREASNYSSITIERMAASVYQNYLSVPVFRQERNWWYAPATVQQVDYFFNKTKYPQSLWADNDHLQTTTSGIVFKRVMGVLNQYVKTGYQYASVGSFDNWHRKIVNFIDYSKPAILDIDTRGLSAFEYSSSGHILNVRGYRFGNVPNEVQVSDPHYAHAGIKMYPAYSLYQANYNHFNSSFIY